MENENLTSDHANETGKTVVKKKRSRPDRTVQTEPGENTRYMGHSLRVYNLGKINMSDPDVVEKRIGEYLTICYEDDMKPSVSGLALALGIDRSSLLRYRHGIIGKNEEVRTILKRAVDLLDQQMTDYMQNGKINPVAGIFLMKNNFGYQDKTEVVVSPVVPLGDQSDENALADRYNDAVVVDDFEDVTDGRPENG